GGRATTPGRHPNNRTAWGRHGPAAQGGRETSDETARRYPNELSGDTARIAFLRPLQPQGQRELLYVGTHTLGLALPTVLRMRRRDGSKVGPGLRVATRR